jgi:hypothetical protein
MFYLRRLRVLGAAGFALLTGSAFMAGPALAASAAANPQITVVGATDGAIALTLTGPSPSAVVTILEQGPAKTVRAQVTPFRSASGQEYKTQAIPGPPVKGTATVTLRANLPFGGPYTTTLSLNVGATTTTTIVSVTRARETAPFTVDSVPTISAVSAGGRFQAITHPVTITETTGQKVTIQFPVAVGSSQGEGSQTIESDMQVLSAGGAGGMARCWMNNKNRTMTIGAGRSCQYQLQLQVPAGAATYATTLRYVTPGYAPLDQAITVQLRRPWLWAVAALALGVVAAVGLRLWLLPRTQALTEQIEVARAREDLNSTVTSLANRPLDADEQEVIKGLNAVLDHANGLARQQRTDASAALTSARNQIAALPAWVLLHRALPTGLSAQDQERWSELTMRMTAQVPDQARADSLLQDLDSYRDSLAKMVAQAPGSGTQMALRRTATGDTIAIPTGLGGAFVRSPLPTLTRRLGAYHLIVSVAAFIIAIITGFLALYLNQPTWGSIGDIIGALLWGLGISAATASVTGFASIQQILTGAR